MSYTTIYYNMERHEICDSKAVCVNYKPQLAYGEKPTWILMLIKSNGYAWDTTGITAWRASVAFDFDVSTPVACRTVAADIVSNGAAVSFQIDTLTSQFLACVNGRHKTDGWFELAGYNTAGERVAYLCFEITCTMIMDPDESEAVQSLTSEYLTDSQIYAIMRSPIEMQFNTTNSGDGHTTQTSADTHFRFRNMAIAGNWSGWIALPSVASPNLTWSYLSGKPTLSIAGQVVTIGENSVTVPAAQIQADWNQTTTTALDYIKNKPTIPAAQIQADWNQTTTTALDYIKNKPALSIAGQVVTIGTNSVTVPTAYVLPTASTSTLGGVKVDGTTVTIDANGVISCIGSSVTGASVTITDAGSYYTGTTVEAALQEIGSLLSGLESTLEAI